MKRVVSIFVSMLVALSMLMSVNNDAVLGIITLKSYAVNSYEGKCGDNAVYHFDSDTGVLTVSGTGSIYDYYISDESSNENKNAPWNGWKNQIKAIEIKNGITNVGSYSFEKCENLKSLKLGSGVTGIGRNAFEECKSLSRIEFSNTVKEIGGWAFLDCTALENINLPSSVEIINRDAFVNTGIKNLVIPDTVKEICRDAFAGCESLESVKFPKRMKELYRGLVAGCSNLTKVVFPEDVTVIGREVFSGCTSLTSISIPKTVAEIGFLAFEGCTSLEHINLPDSIKLIGEAAFDDTGFYNNQSNWENGALYLGDCFIKIKGTMAGDFTVKNGTRVIASKAFYESPVKSVTVPASVKHIGIYPFVRCSKLTSVSFLGKDIDFDTDCFLDKDSTCKVFCVEGSNVHKFVMANSMKYELIAESEQSTDKTDTNKNSVSELSTNDKTNAVNEIINNDTDVDSVKTETEGSTPKTTKSENADNGKKLRSIAFIIAAITVVIIAAVVVVILKKRSNRLEKYEYKNK